VTYIQAALTILAHADRPLTVPEITAIAVAEGLVHPRGKTPDRTMSSVLYRRMAADADAPVISRAGRVWLRGRPLPEEQAGYLARRARRNRPTTHRSVRVERPAAASRATTLPTPPLRLPDGVGQGAVAQGRISAFAPVRRERAVARAGEQGTRTLTRLAQRRAGAMVWDAPRTARQIVLPLLTGLGYRAGRDVLPAEGAARSGVAYTLHAGGKPVIALQVLRLGRDLDEDDAWHALGQASAAALPYAAVCNGAELRLYSVDLAEGHDDLTAALVARLDLTPLAQADPAWSEQATTLWLLSRQTVAAGGLDAYALDRAVGRALLEALDTPASPLAAALVAEVRARAGLSVTPELALRHARLVLRGQRGRDGEPLPADVPAVAAVREVQPAGLVLRLVGGDAWWPPAKPGPRAALSPPLPAYHMGQQGAALYSSRPR